jgi:hypothetical protein
MMIVIAANKSAEKLNIMNAQTNTTDQTESQHKSTYALLARSEEKSRNVFEMAIYPLLILGPLVALWQFARQPVTIPADGLRGEGGIASLSEIQHGA